MGFTERTTLLVYALRQPIPGVGLFPIAWNAKPTTYRKNRKQRTAPDTR